MRLLKRLPNGSLGLTEDLEEDDLPPYAILSHTWGPNEEEVTYKDLVDGIGRGKKGYRKLEFCEKQARHDGQTHFWVDTCCIDKTNSVELNTAITSMFDWYAKATKCYVYLPDVVKGSPTTEDDLDASWQAQFRDCRWLTRGWTLQELLAPKVVEFYDRDDVRLGDKATLECHLCELTGVPAAALRGRDLSSFSIPERFSWQRTRRTKKPEDAAYSLSGICGVSMIPVYGEGKDRAMARLRKEIDDMQKGKRRHVVAAVAAMSFRRHYRLTFAGRKRDDFSILFGDAKMVGVEKFVARERELGEIHTALNSDGSRRTVVLHGLGGIGKTQLAIAYAKRHKDDYSASFWLNMQDSTTAKQSLVRFAKRVLQHHLAAPHLSSVDLGGSADEATTAVLAWLGMPENTRWLAICDNYDNPKISSNEDPAAVDIRDFLPEAYQGSVIVTTRSSQLRMGLSMPMRKLTRVEESVEILSSMSRRPLSAEGRYASMFFSGGTNDVLDPDVLSLVRTLDGLPLALATTGSYLDQVNVSIAEYLDLYRSSWRQLHEGDPGLDTYEDRTLYSTWRILLDHIERRNELSARLLELWCYFGNQDLWYELLRSGPTEDVPWLARLTESLPVFTEAMRLLCSYGLVDSDTTSGDAAGSGGYSVHLCVHTWSVHVLNKKWNGSLVVFAATAIGKLVHDKIRKQPWVTQRRLLPHADRCLPYLREMTLEQARIGYALGRFGKLYYAHRNMGKAEEMYLLALNVNEALMGPEHDNTLKSVHSLANVYTGQGKLQKAEEMYLRVLRGEEKASGRDHVSTLHTVNNLGFLYQQQGNLQKAEEMLLRALQGREKALGPEHIFTLYTVHMLGNLYRAQGNFHEAEKMLLRALQGQEKASGLEDITVLDTLYDLGNLYQRQGQLQKAEGMCLRALHGWEKALGSKHLSTLDTVYILYLLYNDQGRLEEAERMGSRAMEGYKEVEADRKEYIRYLEHMLSGLDQQKGMCLPDRPPTRTAISNVCPGSQPERQKAPVTSIAPSRAEEPALRELRRQESYEQSQQDPLPRSARVDEAEVRRGNSGDREFGTKQRQDPTTSTIRPAGGDPSSSDVKIQESRQGPREAPAASTSTPNQPEPARGQFRKRDRLLALFSKT